jgi:hypothetical protein
MPTPARRVGPRLVARVVLLSLLALAALPAYLTVSPRWRPAAARLAGALVVAIGCARARAWARDAVAPPADAGVDAPPPPPPERVLDPRFLRLRDDLIAGTRRRRYFDVMLWPRLAALAGPDLPRPEERRGPTRRGPSLRAIEGLVARIEERP